MPKMAMQNSNGTGFLLSPKEAVMKAKYFDLKCFYSFSKNKVMVKSAT